MRLVKDVIQLISQYSTLVYCKLRCLNHEVKAMVDEVLPFIPDEIDEHGTKRRRTNVMQTFLSYCGHCCGMILLQQNLFDDWIDVIKRIQSQDEKYGDCLELLCRNSLPTMGYIHPNTLRILCKHNRKEFVRELWNDATNKQSRFLSDCIAHISMMDDLELLKRVHDSVANQDWLQKDISAAVMQAMYNNRWKNMSYLLTQHPNMEIKTGLESNRESDHWNAFISLASNPKDKENAINIVQQNGTLLEHVDESLLQDKDVVQAAVKQYGLALQFAHESLRKDNDVVMEAVKQYGIAIKYADESLRKDKDVVMEAVKGNGNALEYAHESLRKDKEVVMEAVKQDGGILEIVDESLLQDKDVILAAVKQCGMALYYADESLRKDKEIVMAAVKQDGSSLYSADESLRKDRDVVMAAVKQDGLALQFADESLLNDRRVVMTAVKHNAFALQFADESLREDDEFIMATQ